MQTIGVAGGVAPLRGCSGDCASGWAGRARDRRLLGAAGSMGRRRERIAPRPGARSCSRRVTAGCGASPSLALSRGGGSSGDRGARRASSRDAWAGRGREYLVALRAAREERRMTRERRVSSSSAVGSRPPAGRPSSGSRSSSTRSRSARPRVAATIGLAGTFFAGAARLAVWSARCPRCGESFRARPGGSGASGTRRAVRPAASPSSACAARGRT